MIVKILQYISMIVILLSMVNLSFFLVYDSSLINDFYGIGEDIILTLSTVGFVCFTPILLIWLVDAPLKRMINYQYHQDMKLTLWSAKEIIFYNFKIPMLKCIFFLVLYMVVFIVFIFYTYTQDTAIHKTFYDSIFELSLFGMIFLPGIFVAIMSVPQRLALMLKGYRKFYCYSSIYFILAFLAPILYIVFALLVSSYAYTTDYYDERRAIRFFWKKIFSPLLLVLMVLLFLRSVIWNSLYVLRHCKDPEE